VSASVTGSRKKKRKESATVTKFKKIRELNKTSMRQKYWIKRYYISLLLATALYPDREAIFGSNLIETRMRIPVYYQKIWKLCHERQNLSAIRRHSFLMRCYCKICNSIFGWIRKLGYPRNIHVC
jgi:hypothetical protein